VYLVGYNFQCDIKQLAHSYGELECFKQYEMLLDVQNVFKEPRGGLSGLAKVKDELFYLLQFLVDSMLSILLFSYLSLSLS